MDYLAHIDTDTLGLPGMRCRDITPMFADAQVLRALASDLFAPFAGHDVELVVGIEALGYVLATAVAMQAGKGLVAIRKAGKLPVKTHRASFSRRGEPQVLEMRVGALQVGQRVLIVDDWIRTGVQMRAALELIEAQGAIVVGLAAINIEPGEATRDLRERYLCSTVLVGGQPVRHEKSAGV